MMEKASRDDPCALCSLPVGMSRLQLDSPQGKLRFCCPGCLHVFQILFSQPGGPPADFRNTELYRRCAAAGFVPGPEGKRVIAKDGCPDPTNTTPHHPEHDSLSLETSMRIDGMWCPACTWLIEETLDRHEGILAITVDFLSDHARVRYLPHRIRPQEIVTEIRKLGYEAGFGESQPDAARKKELLQLGIASILTLNIMMISFALYGGFFQNLGKNEIGYLSFPLFILATPVLFISGAPILRRAWQGFLRGKGTMDSLIAAGSLTAYGYSIVQMFRGSLHLYFDTAAMLITLVLLGRLIESNARHRVTKSIDDLQALANQKVRLLQEGRERWIAAAALAPGDDVVIEKGERVAADGIIKEGSGDVDESILTGEPRPVAKKRSDEILAGSLLLSGKIMLTAKRTGPDSSLGQMLELVKKALAEKNPLEELADRITRWFVPAILFLAAATLAALLLRGAGIETAMLRAVTVLVIACPCALGIATPLAKVAVLGKAKAMGILIRNAAAFEQARQLDVMIFDKTGTLTEGSFSLCDLYAPTQNEAESLKRAAALEAESDHFLAREIRRQAEKRGIVPAVASNCRSLAGLGVSGIIGQEEVLVGNDRLMTDRSIMIPGNIIDRIRAAEERGLTVIFVAWQGSVQALLAFGDSLKPGMGPLVTALQERGLNIQLLSGDSRAATATVADQLGIGQFVWHCLPADKAAHIRELQGRGLLVGMVGDGINDAAALAQADVGFAVGSNPAGLMNEAADIALLGDMAPRLPEVLDLSALMRKAIRQNLVLAFLYNAIGIPLAASGLLNPLIAVSAMFASSITVIGNTLRLGRT